jgi:DNA-binding MarR family transcriptional regulator
LKIKNTAELALDLGRSMTEMKNVLRQQIQTKIKENKIDITYEMLEIMGCLWRQDGINQQEISDLTIKDKSSMTYLVDNLVKRNMVTRKVDENDRRNNLICLTKEGKLLQKKLYPWISDMYAEAVLDVQTAEISKAIRLIKKMTENLKAKIKH